MDDGGGDTEGFDRYVEANGARLTRVAFILTGDILAAEDLVQDTLVRLLRAWPAITSGADNLDAYTRRVLVNTARRRFRRRRLVEVLSGSTFENAEQAVGFALIEERDRLAGALRSLPRRQRQVVALRYYEDLPEADVAEILGCSVGTVKSQSSKALRKLRRHPAFTTDLDAPEVGR